MNDIISLCKILYFDMPVSQILEFYCSKIIYMAHDPKTQN